MAVNQIGKIITTKSPTVYNLCKYMAVNQIGKIITTKSPTVYNLCKYIAVNQIGKIITTKSPTALYDSITLSPRNDENRFKK